MDQEHAPPLTFDSSAEARARYRDLVARLGAGPGSDAAFDEVWASWTGPARHYHDDRHLAHALTALEQSPLDARDRDLAALALWWHDLIQQESDAERKSAVRMRQVLSDVLPEPVIARVEAAILGTAHGDPDLHLAADPVIDVVHDCDLSILAADPPTFERFEDDVRAEYAHVDRDLYATVRGRLLRGMLEQERLYRSAWGQEQFEQRARERIAGTLAGPRYQVG